MKKSMITRAALLCAGALLAAAGTAQAALQDRDLDGNGEVDAFYDTDFDITWLRNADVNGRMDWDSAVAWADGFSFAGYDDWRLPTTLQPDPSCSLQSGGATAVATTAPAARWATCGTSNSATRLGI